MRTRLRSGSETVPSTSARTTSGARCSTRSISTRRPWASRRAGVGADRDAGRGRHRRLGAPRPGDLGGAGRAQALRLVEADALGRGRPRAPAGRRSAARAPARRPLGGDRRGVPRGDPRTRRPGRDLPPALRDRRTRRFPPADPPAAVPAPVRPPGPRHRAGDRARPDAQRLRAALPRRGDRRRAARRGGHLHDLLLLARLGPERDRGAAPRPRALRAPARLVRGAQPLRRGDPPGQRPPARELSAGIHAPGADQRGVPRDRRRDP